MGSRKTPSDGDKDQCRENEEDPQDAAHPTLGVVWDHDNYLPPAEDVVRFLDFLRRVHTENPKALFRSAVPTDAELKTLSAAGILRAPTSEETLCRVDYETGEILCEEGHPADIPKKDCRLPYCRHAEAMRARVLWRLRLKYAKERRR